MNLRVGVAGMAALVMILGTTVAATSPAFASTASPNAGISADASLRRPAHAGFDMLDRFAREVTRYGDADTSPYDISHVRELQYRLRWAGVFHVGVTGTFGPVTRRAVKRYQSRKDLRVTGVASHATWAHLIHDTIRHRHAIPHICHKAGWHACYDRSMHQVTSWHNGRLRNSWLVRGGEYGLPTRVGNTHVYYRDIDHVSRLYSSPMPYSQFFDGGQAFHGSGFMVDPFVDHSHGCVNMYIEDARQLWRLTSKKRLHVSVYGAWD